MKTSLVSAGALLLAVGASVFAHQVDEYVQATTFSVEMGRVRAQVRLTPGVSVFPTVFARIDSDGNGLLSPAEQRAYAERVVRDLSLAIDGTRVPFRLVSWKADTVEDMRDGSGEIQLDLEAAIPPGGPDRRLVFENRHESRIAAYLVNCLVPSAPGIRITAQERNYEQSVYRLSWTEPEAR
jgi:hypothetical protein